jgi:ribosomal protein S18 acetylase RimI-like enzyme
MNIQIRKVKPEDVETLVPFLYDSGTEAFQYVFNTGKKKAIDFLRYSLKKKGGEFGHGCHSCVLDGDKLIGIGAEFSGIDSLRFLWNNAIQIISFYGFRSPSVIFRGLRVERVLVPPKKGVHYIAHLDIHPEYRGKGIGTSLINHFISNGKNLKRNSVELDVAVNNPGAKKLYEEMGFEYDHIRESKLIRNEVGVPSYERMILREASQ